MAILISGKVDFREKKTTTGREEHYIMIKGSIHQDIQCMCMQQRAAKTWSKNTTELQGEIDKVTIINGNLNTPSQQQARQKNP